MTADFQSQTFEVARYCVRGRVDPKELEVANWTLASGDPETLDGMRPVALGTTMGIDRRVSGREGSSVKQAQPVRLRGSMRTKVQDLPLLLRRPPQSHRLRLYRFRRPRILR